MEKFKMSENPLQQEQSKEKNISSSHSNVDVQSFKRSSADTGSSETQIAQLTKRINELSQHFKTHKKDFHSQTGLIKIINRRKKLLSYLKKNHFKRYQSVVHQLGLRK